MDINILILTALSIGFFHTLLGPDHYLPFMAMAKSFKWSFRKTMSITFLCGVGHVMGSVVLGFLGIILGVGLSKLTLAEEIRGNYAAWLLLAIGIIYMIWGIKKAMAYKPHSHFHTHADGAVHIHSHDHLENQHKHLHPGQENKKSGSNLITPWTIFLFFVFGPCEPLIPILMYPASKLSLAGVTFVVLAFFIATVSTMMTVVGVLFFGLNMIKTDKLERYIHALSGATISISAMGIIFLGF